MSNQKKGAKVTDAIHLYKTKESSARALDFFYIQKGMANLIKQIVLTSCSHIAKAWLGLKYYTCLLAVIYSKRIILLLGEFTVFYCYNTLSYRPSSDVSSSSCQERKLKHIISIGNGRYTRGRASERARARTDSHHAIRVSIPKWRTHMQSEIAPVTVKRKGELLSSELLLFCVPRYQRKC